MYDPKQMNSPSLSSRKTSVLTAFIGGRAALAFGGGVRGAVLPLQGLSTVLHGAHDISPDTVAMLARFLGGYGLAVVIDLAGVVAV